MPKCLTYWLIIGTITALSSGSSFAKNVKFMLYGDASYNFYWGDRGDFLRKRRKEFRNYNVNAPIEVVNINTTDPHLKTINEWGSLTRVAQTLWFNLVTNVYSATHQEYEEICKFSPTCLFERASQRYIRSLMEYDAVPAEYWNQQDPPPPPIDEAELQKRVNEEVRSFSETFKFNHFRYEIHHITAVTKDEILPVSSKLLFSCTTQITGETRCEDRSENLASLLESYTVNTQNGFLSLRSQTIALYSAIAASPTMKAALDSELPSNQSLAQFREFAMSHRTNTDDDEGRASSDKIAKVLSYAAQWALSRGGMAFGATTMGLARLAFSAPGSVPNLLPLYERYLASPFFSLSAEEMEKQIKNLEKAIVTLKSWPQTESVAAAIRNLAANIAEIRQHQEDRGKLTSHGYGVYEGANANGSSQQTSSQNNGEGSASAGRDADDHDPGNSDAADRNADDRETAPEDDVSHGGGDTRDEDTRGAPEQSDPPDHPDVDIGGPD